MNKQLKYNLTLLIAFLISFIIFFLIRFQTFTINKDGILYLQTAFTILDQGLKPAAEIYNWPFFPILIAYFSKLTTISNVSSAYFFCGLFQALIVVFFIGLIKEFSDDPKVWYAAALIILIYPMLNIYRGYIIRDFGYWAFLLLSLIFFIKYIKTNRFIFNAAWFFTTVLASLFRYEGLLFIGVLPLVYLVLPDFTIKNRIKQVLKLYSLPFSVALVLWLVSLFRAEANFFSSARVNYIKFVILKMWPYLQNNFSIIRLKMMTYVLPVYSKEAASQMLLFGFAGFWVLKIVQSLGWVFTGLLIYSLYRGLLPLKNPATRVLWLIVLVYCLISAFFLMTQFFLVKRYLMGMDLILLVWVPFALVDLYNKWGKSIISWEKILFILLILILIEQAMAGTIRFGHSKAYIKEGALWLKKESHAEDRVCTNYKFFLFSVKGIYPTFEQDAGYKLNVLKQLKTFDCHYYGLILKPEDASYISDSIFKRQPINVFQNRANGLYIYKI